MNLCVTKKASKTEAFLVIDDDNYADVAFLP